MFVARKTVSGHWHMFESLLQLVNKDIGGDHCSESCQEEFDTVLDRLSSS